MATKVQKEKERRYKKSKRCIKFYSRIHTKGRAKGSFSQWFNKIRKIIEK